MIRLDPQQVEAARQGSRAALEAIIRATERPIYNCGSACKKNPVMGVIGV